MTKLRSLEPICVGQRWWNKATGKVVTIGQKASGNKHWRVGSRRIHEGTLRRFYERV